MGVMNEKVMVLNKVWYPIRIVSLKRALKLIFAEKAFIVDIDFSTYSWEKWENISVNEDEIYIQTTRSKVKIPLVIVLKNYDKVCKRPLRLTKKNIFLRDGNTCQYSGKKVNMKDADIDHIIPKSRGGENNWNNMVVCCKEINRKKGNKTPEECGLKLIKTPTTPTQSRFLFLSGRKIPDFWKNFLVQNNK